MGITYVRVQLKNTVRTTKSYDIIRKVEGQLLKKHVQNINNTIELSILQRYMYRSVTKGFPLGIAMPS